MMRDRDDNADPNDPSQQLRRRVMQQVGDEPTAEPSAPQEQAPVAPAPFDASPQQSAYDPYAPSGNREPEPPPAPAPVYQPPPAAPAPAPAPPPTRITYNDPPAAFVPAPSEPTQVLAHAAPEPQAASGDWNAQKVTDYFRSRGVQPFATSPEYWAGKWNEWGKNDPAYFMQRLSQADEFTGVGPNYNWQAAGKSDPGTLRPPDPTPTGGGQASAPASAPGLWDAASLAQLRAMIMQRLQAAGSPVDENDASIQAPLIAARNEAARQTDTERTAMAERLYADGHGGLNSNALVQGIQQSNERNAVGLGSLRATLITRELQSRRNELKDIMQMALASGDAQSAREIQMQMAALDAQLRREGMDLDAGKYQAYLNQQAALAGLNG